MSLHHRIRRHLCSVSGISSSPPLIRRFRRENRGAGNMETRSLSTPFAFPAEKALDKSVLEAQDYALFPLPDKRFVSGGLFKTPPEQCLHLFRIFRLIPEVIQ